MFDQDGDESLEGSIDRSVEDRRAVRGIVLADVAEIEALGRVVVELDRAELPLTPDAVGHLKIDFRSVKGAVPWLQLVGPAEGVQRTFEKRLGPVPQGIVADALHRAGGELRGVLEANRPVDAVDERDKSFDLLRHLGFEAVNVRIVLSKLAHSGQAAEGAGRFVPVQHILGVQSQGKVAIAVPLHPVIEMV